MKLVKLFLVACLLICTAAVAEAQNGRGYRNGSRNGNNICPRLAASFVQQPLSAEEAAKLLFMREEEKLSMDVYQALYQKWQVRIFDNIAASEKRHFDALGTLIVRYELSDPAKSTHGEFTDPDLQKLYTDLHAKGMLSFLDALEVGVAIEEKDIDDLKDAISVTDNKDILMVYGNLMNGSLSHLAAFNSHLEISGKN